MAELHPNQRKLARRLAEMTVKAGESAASQVAPALERLVGDRPLAERRAFARAYLNYLRREIRDKELVIEHAGPIQESAVREIAVAFAAQTGRRFNTVTRENPALIGGLRLIQGDNIYDASIAGRLSRLSASAF